MWSFRQEICLAFVPNTVDSVWDSNTLAVLTKQGTSEVETQISAEWNKHRYVVFFQIEQDFLYARQW